MKRSFIFCLPVLLIGLASCEYVPNGTNFHNVNVPTPDIDFTIPDSNDVKVLRGYARISFQPVLNGHTVLRLELQVDNGNTYFPSLHNNYIDLNTAQYSDGEHRLKFTLTTTTNSGSLATKYGSEVFKLQKEYRVYLFNAPLQPLMVRQIANTNGILKIEWDKYTQPGFRKYIVRKYDGGVLAEITDSNRTECFDNQFIGGYAQYQVDVNVGGTEIHGDPRSFSGPVPSWGSITPISDSSKVRVTWTRSTYDSAFASYFLYRSKRYVNAGDRWIYDTIAVITDINQASYLDDNPMFRYSVYGVAYVSQSGKIIETPDQTQCFVGKSFPLDYRVRLEYVPVTNRLYATWAVVDNFGQMTVYSNLYDGTTFQSISSRIFTEVRFAYPETSSDVSANGQWAYMVSKSEQTPQVYQLDPSTLAPIGSPTILGSIYPGTLASVSGIGVSDNNRLAVFMFDGSAKVALFDMNARRLLARTTDIGNNFAVNLQVNNNGTFIMNYGHLFQFINDTLIKIANVPINAKFMNEPDRIVQQVGARLQILQLPSMAVLSDFDIGSEKQLKEFDPRTGYVGCESATSGYYFNYHIINPATGNFLKRIPVASTNYRFQNSTLFGETRRLSLQF